jgi:hypothetical protein
MNIIFLEADPIFIEFEFIVFEGNVVIIGEGLLYIEERIVEFEVLDDGILGVVRVEVGVRVDVLDELGFAELGLEFENIGGVFEVFAGRVEGFVAVS